VQAHDAGVGGAGDDLARQRMALVDRIVRRGITDQRVLRAMRLVPRERFVPPALAHAAYTDTPLPIGAGQTISAPSITAFMTQALRLEPSARVLEVGTGRGYAAAILAQCCAEVVTIERHSKLADTARSTLSALGYDNVEVRTGDGSQGAPDRAPFDAISVTAMAQGGPPPQLLTQLTPHGVLVCPIGTGHSGTLVRIRDGQCEELLPVAFVPLVTLPPGSTHT